MWFLEGEVLAMMEESSRDFLYPGPRLSSREGAAEREILMKRSSSFPVGSFPSIPFISLLTLLLRLAPLLIKLLRIALNNAPKSQPKSKKVIG